MCRSRTKMPQNYHRIQKHGDWSASYTCFRRKYWFQNCAFGYRYPPPICTLQADVATFSMCCAESSTAFTFICCGKKICKGVVPPTQTTHQMLQKGHRQVRRALRMQHEQMRMLHPVWSYTPFTPEETNPLPVSTNRLAQPPMSKISLPPVLRHALEQVLHQHLVLYVQVGIGHGQRTRD